MLLIVGLGNPGKQYELNRHNLGFIIIDFFIEKFRRKSRYSKFNSEIIEITSGGKELQLLKPLTYMNNAGSAIRQALNHYINIESLIVIHDDLDIEFGKIKFKKNGGTAGHNGLKSIASSTGNKDFDRLRIGIGRPPGKKDPSTYVLENFSKKELEELEFIKVNAVDALIDYIEKGIDFTMNKYN